MKLVFKIMLLGALFLIDNICSSESSASSLSPVRSHSSLRDLEAGRENQKTTNISSFCSKKQSKFIACSTGFLLIMLGGLTGFCGYLIGFNSGVNNRAYPSDEAAFCVNIYQPNMPVLIKKDNPCNGFPPYRLRVPLIKRVNDSCEAKYYYQCNEFDEIIEGSGECKPNSSALRGLPDDCSRCYSSGKSVIPQTWIIYAPLGPNWCSTSGRFIGKNSTFTSNTRKNLQREFRVQNRTSNRPAYLGRGKQVHR